MVRALDDIAIRAHWKLIALTKASCPATAVPVRPVGVSGEWVACDEWHKFAINRINQIEPDLLVVSQAPWSRYTPAEWQNGLEKLFRRIRAPRTKKIVIGDIPVTSVSPDCLVQHVHDVQVCSQQPSSSETPYNNAERLAAIAQRATYVDVTPWFCAKTCSAVIGNYDVYYIARHVAVGYSQFLEGVLAQALDLSSAGHGARGGSRG